MLQILRKIFSGSWEAENIIITLLIFNLGCTFTIGLMLAGLRSDYKHLSNQFKSLVSDFKNHIKRK